jgi:hypothetical protein
METMAAGASQKQSFERGFGKGGKPSLRDTEIEERSAGQTWAMR